MTNQSTPLDKITEYKNQMQPNRPINYMYMKYTCGSFMYNNYSLLDDLVAFYICTQSFYLKVLIG